MPHREEGKGWVFGCLLSSGAWGWCPGVYSHEVVVGSAHGGSEGELRAVNGHLTLFNGDSSQVLSEAEVQMLRERMLLAAGGHCIVGGDLVPILINDEPHRLILNLRVDSLLASNLYAVRNAAVSRAGGGSEHSRRGQQFHISLDSVGQLDSGSDVQAGLGSHSSGIV